MQYRTKCVRCHKWHTLRTYKRGVFICGKCKREPTREVEEAIEEEKDFPDGEPTIDWLKKELLKYADENGIPIKTDDTKKEILEKIENYGKRQDEEVSRGKESDEMGESVLPAEPTASS